MNDMICTGADIWAGIWMDVDWDEVMNILNA